MILISNCESENLHVRRIFNQTFMGCLVEVMGGCPSALVWLKRNVDFEICDIMLRDWINSGKLPKP